jgi:hypothetical protein
MLARKERQNNSGKNGAVCPESTIESANMRSYVQRPNVKQSSKNLACESTVESANRRDFIRKAALTTAAAGIGGVLLGSGGILPRSSASGPISGSCPTGHGVTGSSCSGVGVYGVANLSCGIGVYGFSDAASGCSWGVYGQSDSTSGIGVEGYAIAASGHNIGVKGIASSCCGTGVYGLADASFGCTIGVFGESDSTCGLGVKGLGQVGVYGQSCRTFGIGVLGLAGNPGTTPIIANGTCCQTADLQQWEKAGNILSVVNKCGAFGIGTSPGCFMLNVNAPNQLGIHLQGPSSTVGAGLTLETVKCGSSVQEWEILDTGCAALQGPKKLNIRNVTTGIDIFTMCGPNSRIGINNISPTVALCVVGSTFSDTSSGSGVHGKSSCASGNGVLGCSPSSGTGVKGLSTSGIGVLGQAGSVGVEGVAGTAGAVPIVAKGVSGQTANLQQWEKGCTIKSVVNKCGWLGIGTPSPTTNLDVNGSIIGSKLTLNQTVLGGTTLRVDGSISAKALSKSASYTMGASDFAILASGSSTIITLPSAHTANGMLVFIKNVNSTNVPVTVKPGGTDKIDGSTSSRPLATAFSSLTLVSDGVSNWYIQGNAT